MEKYAIIRPERNLFFSVVDKKYLDKEKYKKGLKDDDASHHLFVAQEKNELSNRPDLKMVPYIREYEEYEQSSDKAEGGSN